MRITNRMMINNSLSNINVNKNQMNTMDTQLATQKKISRPSEDPIVAIRALRLRTNLNEIEQYLEKNIPDADHWMTVTEDAADQANDIVKDIYEKCNQGSTDSLSTNERQIIADSLVQLKNGFYSQGDVDYAGRYVFTGFKTDSSLTFQTDTEAQKHSYSITQKFTFDDIKSEVAYTNLVSAKDAADTSITADSVYAAMPEAVDVYRINLAYKGVKNAGEQVEIGDKTYSVTETIDPNTVPGDDEIVFNTELGQLILGKNVYEEARKNDITFSYDKDTFVKGDLKPEHYFTCTDKTDPDEPIEYKYEVQDIEYTINYAQKLKVNTQAADVFDYNFGRDIDDLVNKVQLTNEAEEKLNKLKDMLKREEYKAPDAQERIGALIDAAQKEYDLCADRMQKAFDKGNTLFQKYEQKISAAISDNGNRMARLKLTEARLSEQKTSVTNLKSENEDVELEDVVVNYSSAELVYNASLNSASKVVRQSLLDFL